MKKNYFYRFLLISVSLFISSISNATDYHVASNGNDNNTGSSSAPWQTISKVNSMMNSFVSGDRILFNKGDKFFGQITSTKSGAVGNEIIFGSYGSGPLPVITGKKTITDWSPHLGNIYKANFTDTVSHLYVNDKLMTIARYPNTGYLRVDAGNGTGGFSDAQLTESAGYWNGTNCRIRTINWSYETKTVLSFSAGAVTFSSPSQYTIVANSGYYFDNKMELLDSECEWFQDLSSGIIYFYAPGGVNPNFIDIEGTVNKYCFYQSLNRSNLIVQDLKLSGAAESGIDIQTSTNFKILRCYINHTGKFGIRLNGSTHVIQDNTIEDNFNIGLTGVLSNTLISENLFNRTGLIPGYGRDGIAYSAIQVFSGFNTIVEYNTVDSSGYSGMRVSKNMIIRKNNISYSCITLNDGGGIDLNDADGLQILNNIITYTVGKTESSSTPESYGKGIYFGNILTKNVLIQENTVAHSGYCGIYVDNKSTSVNNQFIDNILYNNYYSQIVFTDFSSSSYTASYSNIISGNIFYGLSLSQSCMEHQMFRSANFSDYGDFEDNYYCNPYTETVVRRTMVFGSYSSRYLRLPTWQNEFNEDLTSNYSQFSFDQHKVIDTLSGNLITNSRFATNITPWTTTPAPGSVISHTTNLALDTGCMRNTWTGVGSYESMTSSNYVNMIKGNYYFLSLSCAGNTSGDLNTFGRPVVGGNPFIYPRRFLGYETYRRDHSFVFRADTNDANMRVAICLWLPDQLVYVDNVYLYQVSVERIDSTEMSKLFTNMTSSAQVLSLNGITYKDPDGTIVTGSITLQPYTSRILIYDYPNLSTNLKLTSLIQGFYNSSSNKMFRDTLKVFLRNTSSPYQIIDSAKSLSDSTGFGNYYFTKAVNGVDYFITVTHRNTIETWSSAPINFVNKVAAYNFTSSSSQAYGSNLIQIDTSPVKFAMYNGDINQDGQVDAVDLSGVDNDVFGLRSGYLLTELTGDNFVDALDLQIVDNNSFNFVKKITPP